MNLSEPQAVRTKSVVVLWVGMILLILFKLWLVADQPIMALADARYDDRLFVQLADHLVLFDWLGPYDNLTLVKGPFYPIWIAVAFLAGVPLLLSQQILYAMACLVTERALQPLIVNCLSRMAIFILLLFNPVTFTWQLTRVLRDGLYPGLALLVTGSAIGLFVRRHESACSLTGWAVTCGLATAAFWLTREEGVWILPVLVPFVGWTMAVAVFSNWRDWPKIAVVTLPLALPLLAIHAVSLTNWIHYSVYTTVEVKTPEFKAAYGALTRVRAAEHKPQVPVTKETRQRIYPQSPAFAELQPSFEREGFWTFRTVGLENHPSGSDEIGGGWFMWALRDAAAEAGYFGSGAQAAVFFQRLANEINAACREKRLDCLPKRASLMPPWRSEYLLPVMKTIFSGFKMLVTFSGVSPTPAPSRGPAVYLALFQDLARERLSGQATSSAGERQTIGVAGIETPSPRQTQLAKWKLSLLEKITVIYRSTIPYFAIATLVAIGVWLFRLIRLRKITTMGFIALIITIAICVRLLILAMIDVTSFLAIIPEYSSPLYPMALLCASLFVMDITHQSR